MRFRHGFTMVEIMIAMVLMVFSIATMGAAAMFGILQVQAFRARVDAQVQINYLEEDLRLHVASATAVDVDLRSQLSGRQKLSSFSFTGEVNVYRIDPNNAATKTLHNYGLRKDILSTSAGDPNDVLRVSGAVTDILVEGFLRPTIEFSHAPGDPPSLLTVTVTLTSSHAPAGMSEQIVRIIKPRFWFVDCI